MNDEPVPAFTLNAFNAVDPKDAEPAIDFPDGARMEQRASGKHPPAWYYTAKDGSSELIPDAIADFVLACVEGGVDPCNL